LLVYMRELRALLFIFTIVNYVIVKEKGRHYSPL
jgi:hypothetical protein